MSVTIREQTHQRTCPFGQFSIICRTVTTKRTSTKLTVCILSPHPLVLSEFERILAKSQFKVVLKQLESYVEARDQLIRALPLVAAGGFWVPRQLLSGFVDSILTSQGRRLKTDSVTNLSRREQEVLDSLLENLSNKEIASKLNIAERTVKFHVSNLLSKFGVRRRADLILLTFQRRLSQA